MEEIQGWKKDEVVIVPEPDGVWICDHCHGVFYSVASWLNHNCDNDEEQEVEVD